MAIYALFSPGKLYEIALDKANTAVNLLLTANADTVQAVREKLALLNQYLVKYRKYLPDAWGGYADSCNAAAMAVYAATADGKVTPDEFAEIAKRFCLAYSAFKAD